MFVYKVTNLIDGNVMSEKLDEVLKNDSKNILKQILDSAMLFGN